MKIIKGLGIAIVVLVITFLLGPKADMPAINNTPTQIDVTLEGLTEYVALKEKNTPYLKPDNEARIIWADSTQLKTPYSFVYLHGFSASQMEGSPLHLDIAKKYNANLYLSRLDGHGTNEPEPFADLSVEKLISTAKEAIAIGKLLGDKVIIISCSTGGTLGLYLAASDPDIAGLVLYSPNIDLYDQSSDLVTGPWGLQILRAIIGGEQTTSKASEEVKQYWTTNYRLEGIVQLKLLLEATMTAETFEQVTQPVFVGYYYKNEEEKDKTVSIERMLEMYDQLGTDDSLKAIKAFPNVGAHVISSSLKSKDLESVRQETNSFLENIMGLIPKSSD